MNKKIIIFVAGIMLGVGAIALWKIWTEKFQGNNSFVPSAFQGQLKNNISTEKNTIPQASLEDSEIEQMEADLNSIDDADFGETELSDQSVGL